MEKEKGKKMQKVSKLTPEKEKFHVLQYIGKNISIFFFWSGIRRGWTR